MPKINLRESHIQKLIEMSDTMHQVAAGDSIVSLAVKYNVSIASIKRLNPSLRLCKATIPESVTSVLIPTSTRVVCFHSDPSEDHWFKEPKEQQEEDSMIDLSGFWIGLRRMIFDECYYHYSYDAYVAIDQCASPKSHKGAAR